LYVIEPAEVTFKISSSAQANWFVDALAIVVKQGPA